MDKDKKNGPIHFYPTTERDPYVSRVVEYCVQIGDKQPLTLSQARHLVSSGKVSLDGVIELNTTRLLSEGTWQLDVRGRSHLVVVHGIVMEI